MKSRRIEKLEAQLRSIEQQLFSELQHLLPHAAEHGTNLFTNSRFNPHSFPSHRFAETEHLLEAAEQSVSLRGQLGSESEVSIGALFLAACHESASNNEHRRGPRRLAAWLLSQISAQHVAQQGAPADRSASASLRLRVG